MKGSGSSNHSEIRVESDLPNFKYVYRYQYIYDISRRLFQTLILLKFTYISDFFILYFVAIKLLLFIFPKYCNYEYQSVLVKY